MVTGQKRDYRYLDGEAERTALVDDMHKVRREVLQIASFVPPDQHFNPRYHGWSLAAMLGHLQLSDNLLMWTVELGILGIRLPIPLTLLNQMNDTMARVYRQRVVATSINGIQKKQQTIEAFIRRIPVDKFSKLVYAPALETTLTVEQALQEFFLYHWRDHLDTMRKVDDIHYEPPTGRTLI